MTTRLFALCAAVLAVTGCSGPPAAPTTPEPPRITVTVFRVRGHLLRPHVVRVPRTRPLAAAVLRALAVSARLAVEDGTAKVGLAKASDGQVAAIVYSLTQFPAIRRVDVAGRHGLTRADVASYVPPILVDTPPPGATVPRSFRVAGTASVFEATVVVAAVRDGRVLARTTVTASEGAPARGSFSARLTASPGPLTLRVFAPSAANGAPQHEVDVDVVVRR